MFVLKTKKSTTASHCRALVNIRHSVFVIKYAKTSTGIFGANFLATIEQIFQLCCTLKALPKEMFFDLIRVSTTFRETTFVTVELYIVHRVKTQSSGKTRQAIMVYGDWPKVGRLRQPNAVWDFHA